MSDIIKIDFESRQAELHLDGNGRYNLNDLHKVAGEAARHKPANFLRLETTKALIEALDSDRSSDLRIGQKAGNSDRCSDLSNGQDLTNYAPVEVLQGGVTQGTFVAEELVYAYAMWVSPRFMLKVTRVLKQIARTGTYAQDRWVDFAEYCNLVRKRISPRSKTLTTVPHSVRHALIIARADPAMGDAMVFGDGGALWVREDRLSTAFCISAAKDGQVGRHHFEAVREAEEYSALTKEEVLVKANP